MARSDYHHLYKTARWQKLRKQQLQLHPLCCFHLKLGRTVAGGVVDHVRPHRGDLELFFSDGNLQTLCKPCHDAHKQAQEHNADGVLRGAGLDGKPLDGAHPWHRPITQGGAGQKSGGDACRTAPLPPFAEPRNG
ncbi:HNH endonuclease [Aquabacterium sp. OR-4]|uniref:HNH endonuclease n=1 Tax=Aquabacterium sp. OR-4 TaxID=2978127 RepID=UPI0028CA4A06|nr:HNH endonuclease [Aquabacterium sp. OR-4]MDT7836471.1 HNH endonuclease [Aquabacterium sp. OR-4]